MLKFSISCPHFDICSGCVYDEIKTDPVIFKRAKRYLEKVIKTPVVLQKGDAQYYRTRAKLAVRHNKKDPTRPFIGLFEEGTHKVIPIPECQIHHPKINQAIQLFCQEFQNSDLTAYDEENRSGDLRYLQLVVERRTKKILLCFVASFDEASEKKLQWEHFAKKLFAVGKKTFWHSVWLNFQPKVTNVIFGRKTQHVIGEDIVWEQICSNEIAFGSVHFGQANLDMYEKLIETIRLHIPKNKKLIELYAGTGSIGICLADLCKNVTFFERDENAIAFFEKSKLRLDQELQRKLHYQTGSSESAFECVNDAEIVIVDPPRKGLSKEVIASILDSKATQDLIYISCDYSTFERDARQLWQAKNGFYLHKAFCYLFFPGSNHIETLGFFKRKSSG